MVTVRPAAPWYTERISDEKRKRRKLERRWRASSLDSDYQIYQQQCALVKELLYQLKSDYYSNLISENQSDLRKLFTVIGKLLHRNNSQIFPRHVSSNTLADAFMHFFDNKIRKIRAGMLAQFDTGTPSFTTDVPINCDCELNSFSSATSNNLMTLISAMSFKSSELDPIPGHLLKECIDTVLPTITKVVSNQFLATASFPHQLKEAMIKPLIKKSNLDTDEFKKFSQILTCCYCLLLINDFFKTIANSLSPSHRYCATLFLKPKMAAKYFVPCQNFKLFLGDVRLKTLETELKRI